MKKIHPQLINFSVKFLIIIILFVAFSCTPTKNADTQAIKWEVLFDGADINKWETYLGPCFDEGVTWDNINSQKPVGLNNDPKDIFSIVEINGEKVLRISGECWGGIFTKASYENYHLQFQFKWGQKKWFPRENDKRDSGLLYHGIDDHGEHDLFWLKSLEFQIQEGDCGDFWGVGKTIVDVPAKSVNNDSIFMYDPTGPLLTFTEGSEYGRNCKKYPDAENPSGEWNTVDLYCLGEKSIHMMNGKITMVLENARYMLDGKEVQLKNGKIGLQSEAAEVFYKNIKLAPIEELPL